jgi:hypothetical protein
VAVLLAGGLSIAGVANAADGCGPGCHNTEQGECIVDGWGYVTRIVNECPVTTRPRPPCPHGFAWSRRFGACFPN